MKSGNVKSVDVNDVIWEREELHRSRARGAWDRWGVQDAEIRDGWLFAEFDQRRIYAPLEHEELPHQFALLANGDDRSMASFFNAYGRLGWHELVSEGSHASRDEWLKRLTREYSKQLRQTIKNGYKSNVIYTEPLEWIRAHAQTVKWCLGAARALGEKHLPDSEPYVDLAKTLPMPMGCRASIRTSLFREGIRDKVSARDFVGGMLEDYLWINLKGVRRRVEFTREGGLKSLWGGNSLIESIYTLTTDAAVGGRLRQCSACGVTFIQTDERQRFCPPMEGRAKSACMNRLRVRRYRKTLPKKTHRSSRARV